MKNELRFALRSLLKSPGFTAIALLTVLTLGMMAGEEAAISSFRIAFRNSG